MRNHPLVLGTLDGGGSFTLLVKALLPSLHAQEHADAADITHASSCLLVRARSTCLRNSDSNSPASSLGSAGTLRWPPILRTVHCCQCMAPASALWGNCHSSDDNFPASSRGFSDTLRWLPNLGRTGCHRSMSAEVAGDSAASASLRNQVGANPSGRRCLCTWHNSNWTGGTIPCHPLHNPRNLLRIGNIRCPLVWGSEWSLGLAPAWDAIGTNQSVQRKRSGTRPMNRENSASNRRVCSPLHRDNPRAGRLDRSLASPAETPNPATAC